MLGVLGVLGVLDVLGVLGVLEVKRLYLENCSQSLLDPF